MGLSKRPIAFALGAAVIIVALTAWFVSISCRFPYYFIWDQDHIYNVDTLLVHSGLFPDGVMHPSFGLHLFHLAAQRAAYGLGWISVLTLGELEHSLNPVVAMAERAAFLRLTSPFLCIAMVAMLWAAVCVAFKPRQWTALLLLVFLGTQESLLYHASMVRCGLYSMLFWAGAVLAVALAASARRERARYGWLFVSGMLIGLAFLTKIQALFPAALCPILLWFLGSADNPGEDRPAPAKGYAAAIIAVSVVNLVVFLVLALCAYRRDLPATMLPMASGFGMTGVFLLTAAGFLLPLVVQSRLAATGRSGGLLFRNAAWLTILSSGFLVSFLFHFLVYTEPANGWAYLLADFRVLFFRHMRVDSIDLSMGQLLHDAGRKLAYHPVPFIVNALLAGTLVVGLRRGWVRLGRGAAWLVLAASAVAAAILVVGSRFLLRDVLWLEVPLNLLSLMWAYALAGRARRHRGVLRALCLCLFVGLGAADMAHCRAMPARLDAVYNFYGWDEDQWLWYSYCGNHEKHKALMKERYHGPQKAIAQSCALRQREIRRDASFVFQNQPVTHRNIGVLTEGFPVWTGDPAFRITSAPDALRGAIVVDNASMPTGDRFFFNKELVRSETHVTDKLARGSGADAFSILTRRDCRVFLFVQEPDIAPLREALRLQGVEPAPTDFRVVVSKQGEDFVFRGIEIPTYSEVPRAVFSLPFFSVIQERSAASGG